MGCTFIIPSVSDLNFKERRIKCGLKLREVDIATGISHPTISGIENGKRRNVSYETIQKLNDFYNVCSQKIKA